MFDLRSEANVSARRPRRSQGHGCDPAVARATPPPPARPSAHADVQRNVTVHRAISQRCTAYSRPVPLLGDYRFTTLTSVCPVYAPTAAAASSTAFLAPPTTAPPFMDGFIAEPVPLGADNATLVGFIAAALTRECRASRHLLLVRVGALPSLTPPPPPLLTACGCAARTLAQAAMREVGAPFLHVMSIRDVTDTPAALPPAPLSPLALQVHPRPMPAPYRGSVPAGEHVTGEGTWARGAALLARAHSYAPPPRAVNRRLPHRG
jgi:hypothetical protein